MTTRKTTRSALRASLAQEDAALAERAPTTTTRKPATRRTTGAKPAPTAAPADRSPSPRAAAKSAPSRPAATRNAAARAGTAAKPATRPSRASAPAARKPARKPTATPKPTPAADAPAAKRSRPTSGARTASAPAPAVASPEATPPKVTTVKPGKVVRDSFSIPAAEHKHLKALRQALEKAGRKTSKSEVLRAGIALLSERSAAEIAAVLEGLPKVTRGGSRKNKKSKKKG